MLEAPGSCRSSQPPAKSTISGSHWPPAKQAHHSFNSKGDMASIQDYINFVSLTAACQLAAQGPPSAVAQ